MQITGSRNVRPELRELQRLAEEHGDVKRKTQILKHPMMKPPAIANDWPAAELEQRDKDLEQIIEKAEVDLGARLGLSGVILREISNESRILAAHRVNLRVAESSKEEEGIKTATENILKHERAIEALLPQASESQSHMATSQTRTLLAAIHRTGADQRVTYYIPYESAIGEMTGDILLQDQDLVQVIDYRLTSLSPFRTAAETGGASFTIGGFVQNPGAYEISDALTIGQLAAVADPLYVNVEGVAWTLRRQSPTGLGEEVFIIPTSGPAVSEQILNAPTLGGDEFTFSALPQIPLIFESIARQALRRPLAQRLDPRRIAGLGASSAGQLREGPVAALAQETGLGSRLMRDAHAAHRTMRNHLDLHHAGHR
jgi:hypothetical protein